MLGDTIQSIALSTNENSGAHLTPIESEFQGMEPCHLYFINPSWLFACTLKPEKSRPSGKIASISFSFLHGCLPFLLSILFLTALRHELCFC